MTDLRDQCRTCEAPLLISEQGQCGRCASVLSEWDVGPLVAEMRAASRRHRQLLAVVMTLLAAHAKVPR